MPQLQRNGRVDVVYAHKPSIEKVRAAIERLREHQTYLREGPKIDPPYTMHDRDYNADLDAVIEAAEHGAGLTKFRTHATINFTFTQLHNLRNAIDVELAIPTSSQQRLASLRQVKKKLVAAMQQERWER